MWCKSPPSRRGPQALPMKAGHQWAQGLFSAGLFAPCCLARQYPGGYCFPSVLLCASGPTHELRCCSSPVFCIMRSFRSQFQGFPAFPKAEIRYIVFHGPTLPVSSLFEVSFTWDARSNIIVFPVHEHVLESLPYSATLEKTGNPRSWLQNAVFRAVSFNESWKPPKLAPSCCKSPFVPCIDADECGNRWYTDARFLFPQKGRCNACRAYPGELGAGAVGFRSGEWNPLPGGRCPHR